MGTRAIITILIGGSLLLPLACAGTIEGEVRGGVPRERANSVVSVDDIDAPPVSATAVIDQKNLQFRPHVLPIQMGTTVEFPNSDPVAHNVYSISPAKRFNLGLYRQGTVPKITFDKPGVVALLCNVHLEMSAYVVVLRNPFFAQTNTDGRYRIADVPPGKHRVRCWHENLPDRFAEVDVPAEGTVRLDFEMGAAHGGESRD
jgi:plastocyanin